MSEQLPSMKMRMRCLRVKRTREEGIFQESGSSLRCLLSPWLWGKAEKERDTLLGEICGLYPRCLLGLEPWESRDVEAIEQYRLRFKEGAVSHWYWIVSLDLLACRENGGALGKEAERLMSAGSWCAFFFPEDTEPRWTEAPVVEHEPSRLGRAMRILNASAAIVPSPDDIDWLVGLNSALHNAFGGE